MTGKLAQFVDQNGNGDFDNAAGQVDRWLSHFPTYNALQSFGTGSGQATMGIRPENITVDKEGVAAEIYIVEPLGRDHLLDVQVGDISLRVLADPDMGLHISDTVQLNLNTDKAHFFDPTTERSLLWA